MAALVWVGVASAASLFALARGGRVAPPLAFVCWIFALAAIGQAVTTPEPYPDEFRLVGWGCDGAGDKPLFRNEEDEFPRCDRIEGF